MTLTKRLSNIIAAISLIALAILYWNMFDFLRWDMFDSPSFVGAAKQLFGLEGGYNFQSRLSKPLALVIPGLLDYLFSIDAQYGFIIQTTAAYFGCAFLIKSIVFKLTNRTDLALYAMYIYVLSQPFAIFSLMILTDAPGWFISLLVINKAIQKVKKQEIKQIHWLLLAAASAIGMLFKESVAFSIIFILWYQLFSASNHKQRIIGLILSGGTFIVVFTISQWITYELFNDSILARLFSQQERVGFVYYTKSNAAQLFRIIDFYWLLVLIGIASVQLAIKQFPIQNELFAFSCAFVSSIILIPLYPFIVDRILFMVAPSLVVLGILSTVYLKKLLLPAIFVGGVINISIAWMIYRYNSQGLLVWGLLIYGLILLGALIYENKLSTNMKKSM